MRSDISVSNLDASMARPQSKHKVKRNRWTRIEALNRRKEKSVDSICSGINSKHEPPVVRQVVTNLQELCKAALAIDRANAVMSEADDLEVKQDLKECTQPSVGKGNTEMTHSEVPDILNQRHELSSDTQSSRICGIQEVSSEVLESNNTDKTDGFIKLEICEPGCLKEEVNNMNDMNNPKNVDLDKIIKKEHELDVTGEHPCIHNIVNETISCKAEALDQMADICPLVGQTSANGMDTGFVAYHEGTTPCATTGNLTIVEKQEVLPNQVCGNEIFSNTLNDVVLHDLSRSDYRCCNVHDSVYSGPMKLENQPENYLVAATNEGLLDRIGFSGIGYSTDEDGGNFPGEIQKLSGPQFWMGKRKRVADSLMSLSTEESLDSLVSNGTSVGESLPGLKNYNLKDEISYSTRNCGMMLVGDTDKLCYQEVFDDSMSTRSSPDSRYAPSLVSGTNPYRCVNRAQSWSPTLLSVSGSGAVNSYMKPGAHTPLQYEIKASDTLSGLLCQDVHVLQSAVPTSYTSISVSPAPVVAREETEPGTESLKSDEEELFRRIEESLAERETLKYQEEELLKRIERSLTETQSLKCREEHLLNKIERSLTKAKSLKSQEEELIRRIEVSLGQRETAKSQDEDLLIGMEKSLQDKQYNMVLEDSIKSMEFESESNPDLDNSLPLKKRKKWLKAVTSDENRGLQARSVPLESFPSFPLWPMISIAELEAVGKLQHRVTFPSFPSRPMISIAELESRTAFGKLQHHEFESSTVSPWIPSYSRYCEENNFCDESFCSRDVRVGRMCDEFFEQNVPAVENVTAFPVCKVEDSLEGHSCSEMRSPCALSQLRDSDVSYDKVFRRGEPSSAETSSSVCGDAAEDSKADIKLFFTPATDYLSSEVDDFKHVIQSCEGTKLPSADPRVVNTDSTDSRRCEVTATGSGCMKTIEVLQRIVPAGSVTGMDSKNCTELDEKFETCLESKYIKIEKDSKDRIENCALNYPPLPDVKYKAEMNAEASLSGFRNVNVSCNGSVEMLRSRVNFVDDSGQDLKSSVELQGRNEGNLTFKAIGAETKDNVDWCKKTDVPLKESKCMVDVESRDKDRL
ncbi:hypothetical protein B7P43_G07197 [Cryptotermes secundus]|uniref:Uncharacterized protein n=1 Tax=Cryptotermes secundus TaxID=105785 RepID=A0A2J7PJN4_9NEOP|nr:uncharacterized protein LOC111873511 [Cryptotermes secundus]PNF16528.1 hypothetical protein B7P43_G07197 [Cryptotermes secundus]PNF16529.1 hypothetical protein B7P43_G07197 [Cryptotermes secundus]